MELKEHDEKVQNGNCSCPMQEYLQMFSQAIMAS